TNFLARWTGFITFPNDPTDGASYQIGLESDDGARVYVNNMTTPAYSTWGTTPAPHPLAYSSPGAPYSGGPQRILVDYFQAAGNADIHLWAKSASTGHEFIVPSTWLSPDASALPQGWSVSADLDGSLAFTQAKVSGNSVVVYGADGDSHE